MIELLVVIAIIAILAAILFPVFARARAKSRQSVCQSNLKQLGLAFQQYSQDYDEKFPPPGGVAGLPAWDSVDANGKSFTLDVYLKNRGTSAQQVFACPDMGSGPQPTTGGTAPNYDSSGLPAKGGNRYFYLFPRSYGMNNYLRLAGQPVKLSNGSYVQDGTAVSDVDACNSFNSPPSGTCRIGGLPSGVSLAAVPKPATTNLLCEGIPAVASGNNGFYNGYVGRNGDWKMVGGHYPTAAACKS